MSVPSPKDVIHRYYLMADAGMQLAENVADAMSKHRAPGLLSDLIGKALENHIATIERIRAEFPLASQDAGGGK